MRAQGEVLQMEPASSQIRSDATDLVAEPAFDQEAIALLAYSYWEERGCPDDSPHEDWFRAESDLRNRLAAAATD
jgi:hypothetical protein